MKDTKTIVGCVTTLVALVLGCGARSTSPGGSSAEIEHAPEICTEDGECSTVDCTAIWTAEPLPEPWWFSSAPAACVEAPRHREQEAYDDCALDSTGITAEQCGAPRAGAVICESIGSGRGRVTVSCLSTRDCPHGMACTLDGQVVDEVPDTHFAGVCEKTCTDGTDDSECVRCDMECDLARGTCQLRGEEPSALVPCEADCQCGGVCGTSGFCIEESLGVRTALCGVGDCACTGGTCDERRCCHRPDGTIVGSRSDPMCQFPE